MQKNVFVFNGTTCVWETDKTGIYNWYYLAKKYSINAKNIAPRKKNIKNIIFKRKFLIKSGDTNLVNCRLPLKTRTEILFHHLYLDHRAFS